MNELLIYLTFIDYRTFKIFLFRVFKYSNDSFFHIIWFQYIIMYIDNFQKKWTRWARTLLTKLYYIIYYVYYCFSSIGSHSIGIYIINVCSIVWQPSRLAVGVGGGVVKRATLREKTRKQQCVFIDIYISNILYKHICAEPRPVGAGRSSRTEVRLLPASVPLALEYPDIGHAESGVAQGVAHRVDGAVDVA